MTPMRANIVGPPSVATRIRASIAACHSAKARDVVAGVLQRDELATGGTAGSLVEMQDDVPELTNEGHRALDWN
jgi:hypothetical protein